MSHQKSQLDRIEEKLDQLLQELAPKEPEVKSMGWVDPNKPTENPPTPPQP